MAKQDPRQEALRQQLPQLPGSFATAHSPPPVVMTSPAGWLRSLISKQDSGDYSALLSRRPVVQVDDEFMCAHSRIRILQDVEWKVLLRQFLVWFFQIFPSAYIHTYRTLCINIYLYVYGYPLAAYYTHSTVLSQIPISQFVCVPSFYFNDCIVSYWL